VTDPGPAERAPAPRTLRLAHRGDWRAAPENSLEAMRAALARPRCDGLEFDVRASREGIPVLLHDASLRRVQRVSGRVDALSVDELAAHGIPTLETILAAAGPDPFLDVELKGEPSPAVVPLLEAARGPELSRAVVSSFEPPTLAWLARERPAWERWLNALDLSPLTLAIAADAGCAAISVEWRSIDADGLARAADAGLTVAAWTVLDAATCVRLERLGVVAICVEGTALDG
jgi:glycerophosphoryl diester phosphodiesterase